MEIHFNPCVIKVNANDFLKRIGATNGYYLLKIEEDRSMYGPNMEPAHVTSYTLMYVFESTNGFVGVCGDSFLWDMSGTVTGYCKLGLENEVKPLV